MEILTVCRMCLGNNVRLYSIANTYLQEMFEKLTEIPLNTQKARPIQVCYICRARLHNCYQLRANCLQSEKWFTELINNNKLLPLVNKELLQIHTCINISIPPKLNNPITDNEPSIAIKTEPLLVTEELQLKEEPIQESEETSFFEDDIIQLTQREDVTLDNNVLDNAIQSLETKENLEPRTVENSSHCNVHQGSDIQDTELKDKLSDRTVNNQTKQESFQYRDVCPKIVKVLLQRVDVNNILTNAPVPKKSKLSEKSNHIEKSNSSKLEEEMRVLQNKYIFGKTRNVKQKLTSSNEESHECQCDICKKFFTKKVLRQHIYIHFPTKPFSCGICYKRFGAKNSLLRHKVLLHTTIENPSYKCNICGKYYQTKIHLYAHQHTHIDKKKSLICHKCNICGKTYKTSSHLKRHSVLHAGNKPFKCDICNKGFSQKEHVIRHISRFHTTDSYKCNICERYFDRKNSFSDHIRRYTGKKPYQCSICDKWFHLKLSKKKHEKHYHL